jgi:serine/threonine protein kinase
MPRRTALLSRPGWNSVTQLLDSFFIEGPNGRHLCVVMELLGPSLSWVAEKSQNGRIMARLALQVSAQLVEAVNYLHSCGVVHGGEDGPFYRVECHSLT